MYLISSQRGVAVAAAVVTVVGLSCKWKQSVSILGVLSLLILFFERSDDDSDVVNDSTTATSYDAMMKKNSNQPKQQHNIVIVFIEEATQLHNLSCNLQQRRVVSLALKRGHLFWGLTQGILQKLHVFYT